MRGRRVPTHGGVYYLGSFIDCRISISMSVRARSRWRYRQRRGRGAWAGRQWRSERRGTRLYRMPY